MPQVDKPRTRVLRFLLWHWGRHGGGPRYTLELARALAKDPEIDLHVAISRYSELFPEFERLPVKIYAEATYRSAKGAIGSSLRLPRVAYHFHRYLRDNHVDAVNCTMSHLWNMAMLPAIRAAGVPFLLTLHDRMIHPGELLQWQQALLGWEIRKADQIITLSEAVRQQIIQFDGYTPERIHVVPHGVFGDPSDAFPRQLPVNRPVRLLFFGRFMRYKGLELFSDVIEELGRRGSWYELTLAGSGRLPAGTAFERLSNVRVDNRWIPECEIKSYFDWADIVVLPYIEASQSGVVATAFAAGVPVVTTPVGGLVEQVRNGYTGVVAEASTVEALTSAILTLMRNSALYQSCSRAMLQEARTTLAWKSIADRVKNVCLDMIEQRLER